MKGDSLRQGSLPDPYSSKASVSCFRWLHWRQPSPVLTSPNRPSLAISKSLQIVLLSDLARLCVYQVALEIRVFYSRILCYIRMVQRSLPWDTAGCG